MKLEKKGKSTQDESMRNKSVKKYSLLVAKIKQ
jgi:hypothetical protein